MARKRFQDGFLFGFLSCLLIRQAWDSTSVRPDHPSSQTEKTEWLLNNTTCEPQRQPQLQQPASKTPSTSLSQTARDQWCPDARCDETDLCNPCKRRYLILLATGRSASTTLQNMLHALPGVRMSGENNNMLGNFLHALRATTKHHQWRTEGTKQRHSSWGHYPVPGSALACVVQQMVETINPPSNENGKFRAESDSDTIVGFKTIRFPINIREEVDNKTSKQVDPQDAARFLVNSFPCSKVLINLRRDVATQGSSIKRSFGLRRTSNVTAILARQNERLLQLGSLLGSQRSLVLDSDEWTKNLTTLNEMVSWLGFAPACHFNETFQYNTKGIFAAGQVMGRTSPLGCIKLSLQR